MGSDFDILVWYRLLVFLISGFLPAWTLFLLLSAIYSRSDFVRLLREYYPKALPISNFFFFITQLIGTLIRPSYPGNIFPEIIGNIFFLLLTVVSFSLLILLFFRPGKLFDRFVLITGCLQIVLLIAERASDANDLSDFFAMCGKSILWYLFLGVLIALSELIRKKFKKNDRKESRSL